MMSRCAPMAVLFLSVLIAAAQQTDRIAAGNLSNGAAVSFVRSGSDWTLEVAGPGTPHFSQQRPARVEIFSKESSGQVLRDDVRQLEAAYRTVETAGGAVIARTEIPYGQGVRFRIEDRWSVNGAVLSVRRKLEIVGSAQGGFYSAVMLSTQPDASWSDVDFLAPGLLYADPTDNGERSPGGTLNYAARRLSMREDYLAAPLFALSFRDGNSVTVLDPAPRGDTTAAESHAATGTVMVDERYQFGALGAHDAPGGGVEFGFWLPGTINDFARGPELAPRHAGTLPQNGPTPSWRRRYHPIREGFVQNYEVAFRFGRSESFTRLTRNAFRWAWETLNPAVTYLDVEAVRRTLVDFLADRTLTIEGRTGIPYLVDARTGKFMQRMDATRAAMGFCAKNIEAADQFLREADRDRSPRGERFRKLGLAIIDTFIRLLPMSPPAGDGFDLFTGRITPAVWSQGQQPIRTIAEEMRVLVEAYERERKLGREHPEWLRWVTDYADWLLVQQRPDGSFPRSWKPGTSEIYNASGSASYSTPPLFVSLTQITGQGRYLESAVRAGEYLWSAYGSRGLYLGGAVDASSQQIVTDKEAGMLAMDAFLSLFEATKDRKWLARSEAAGDYTETWIWIWNVPMPADENDADLHWKKGVPTVGLQGITARGAGGTDEYLDWGAPLFAKLNAYTKDPHYLDVTRILLHNTKAMLAMPGRTFGMLGPGWQQEHWAMAHNRGFGQPGKWLPWLATNHLNSIYGIEAFDAALFKRICARPSGAPNSTN
jgi:hypothetical protein